MIFKSGSKGAKRGHAPRSARKWHKIDTFLDIRKTAKKFKSLIFITC